MQIVSRCVLLVWVIFYFSPAVFAQGSVAINADGTAPHSSAMLDVKSTNRGFLAPRMSQAQRAAIASPAAGLMVFDTTSKAYWVYNGTSWAQMGSGGSAQWTTLFHNIYNNNVGNVGIGTNIPGSKLHVENGDIKLRNTSTGEFRFETTPTSSSGINTGITFHQNNDQVAALKYYRPAFISSNNLPVLRMYVGDADANHLTISNGGRVGIGTGMPMDQLDIKGNLRLAGTSPYIRFETEEGGTGTGNVFSTRYTPGLQFVRPGETTLLGKFEFVDTVNYHDFFRLYTGPAITSDLVITAGHRTGIGTTNPLGKLEVSGGEDDQIVVHAATDPIIQLMNGFIGNKQKKGFLQISGDNLRIGTNSGNAAGKFIVRNNGGDRFFIDAAGRVGINQPNPATQLHVSGGTILNNGSNETLALDGTNPHLQFYQSGVARSFIQQMGTTLIVGVNNGNLRLDATQVAIGQDLNTATGFKLAISGKMICEEVKVKLKGAWPDYVFNDSYQLMPLAQLRQFIQRNKHLPDIPAATVVESEGLLLGDMQQKTVQKLEELTLYILQLEEKTNRLQAELDTLKKSLNR